MALCGKIKHLTLIPTTRRSFTLSNIILRIYIKLYKVGKSFIYDPYKALDRSI